MKYSCNYTDRGEILSTKIDYFNVDVLLTNDNEIDKNIEKLVTNIFADKNKICKNYQYLFKTRRFVCGYNLRDYENLLLSESNRLNIPYDKLQAITNITNVALGIVDYNGGKNILNGHYINIPTKIDDSDIIVNSKIYGYYLIDIDTGLKNKITLNNNIYFNGNKLVSVYIEDEVTDVSYKN